MRLTFSGKKKDKDRLEKAVFSEQCLPFKDLRPIVNSEMIHGTPRLQKEIKEEENQVAINYSSFCTFNYWMPVKSKEKVR